MAASSPPERGESVAARPRRSIDIRRWCGGRSAGSFYVAESSESWIGLDRGTRSIQKFVRR
jgi:hypothetical protein